MDNSNNKRKSGDISGGGGGEGKIKEPAVSTEEAVIICPYLDTIQRSILDFDFEPSCSVSLETGPHVYGCLVCGKFFRGKGQHTPAYTHSVDEGHFVYVHLTKGTFHCLPDDYEIKDPSLKDVSTALHPTFSEDDIQKIDSNTGLARDLFGRRYLPGFVGLNNLHKTDYINSTIQALAHVRPLRDYFLRLSHRDTFKKNDNKKQKPPHRISDLAKCFGELIRKMWSNKRFKSNVDPHMLIQAVSRASKKRFQVGHQSEVGEFMAWFLNQLHIGLGGTRKPGSSIVYRTFQGKIESNGLSSIDPNVDGTAMETNFLQLTLDIPEKPLFRDEDGGLVIPQEPLVSVMKKFDGVNFSVAISKSGVAQRKRYRLQKLPPYLVLHLARFKTNNYSREKNPTIVAFPVKNLDLSSYTFPKDGKQSPPTETKVRAMNSLPDLLADKYDLVANITHNLPADDGSYKCHVCHKNTNQWFETQDLHVEETMPQLIGVSESYVLIFERKSSQQIDLSK
ncbi:cysteine proteinase [Fragilariopsis cylindrus CCMP1102]|uniref:Cysteine proteinase n=1 Tax=Fragilariopsis cylindrus CCMP1102 TaxID=635003 RepID=A0A1E7F4F3_9STRA|nr:cysteine proteinase [Fragilariopsis cylindrus CCMP1102]|eukprot:OEU13016.1 cysteine proteinase [Fragilariopsis cylindrus CCMP1102]